MYTKGKLHFLLNICGCYTNKAFFHKWIPLVFEYSSHEEIDVSHPDFFISAKLNGYTPPNKEVIFALHMQPSVICTLIQFH